MSKYLLSLITGTYDTITYIPIGYVDDKGSAETLSEDIRKEVYKLQQKYKDYIKNGGLMYPTNEKVFIKSIIDNNEDKYNILSEKSYLFTDQFFEVNITEIKNLKHE